MPTIKVKPGQLGNVLRTDAATLAGKHGKAIDRALRKAAHRARTALVANTDVDRGLMKASWDVVKLATGTDGGYEVLNTAPYAGVVERGIRPGAKFGRAAHEAIKGWVIRKGILGKKPRAAKGGGLSSVGARYDAEADDLAWAIIKKLEQVGRAGKFKVRDALPALNAELAKYILDEIEKYFAAGGGAGKGGM